MDFSDLAFLQIMVVLGFYLVNYFIQGFGFGFNFQVRFFPKQILS